LEDTDRLASNFIKRIFNLGDAIIVMFKYFFLYY